MGNFIQFIKCFWGHHKWVGIGELNHRGTPSDHIYINGCSFCGEVKLLYVRCKPAPPKESE